MDGKSLMDHILASSLNLKEKKAITFFREGKVETEISYFDLDQDSNRIANLFIDLGVEKGDRVVLFIQKSLFFVIAYLALQKLGAVAIPLNPGFKKTEMEYLLQDAEAKLVLTENENENLVKNIESNQQVFVVDTQKQYQDLGFFRSAPEKLPHVEIEPNDPGLIMYTSGTTGNPKGAIITHKNLVNDANNIINIWEISASDVICHALPLLHIHGLCFALHTALIAGSHVLMLDRFSPKRVIAVLSKKEMPDACTVFMAVPAMYGKLIDYLGDKRLDFDHIRLWTSGSAPLLPQDFERIRNVFGKEPVEREGMTETEMNFSNPLKDKRKPGSIGLPLPALEVRIVDPVKGVDLKSGQTGEIWLKGPAITPGYWRKPEETAKAFEGDWFRTGDMGYVDEDGYYYLTDRIKNIIISGGENISPQEIETVINHYDGVVESSVVGLPDATWGEKVVAAVVQETDSNIKSDDIQEYCKTHLHEWKCPKNIRLVKGLPRNTMGKVLKEEVKKIFNS
jgi:malonyl-CoA/methylmalonyl-CoA synthetase